MPEQIKMRLCVFAIKNQNHFTREVNYCAGRFENNRIGAFEEDKPGLNPFFRLR